MGAELGRRIDLLGDPDAGRRARLDDHRVLHHEEVSLLIADLALLADRAPDVLERVPLEAALPGHIDDRGRFAVAVAALVAALRQHHRAPLPAQPLARLPQVLGHLDAERDGLQRPAVGGAEERFGRVFHDPVVALRAGVALDDGELVHVELGFGEPQALRAGRLFRRDDADRLARQARLIGEEARRYEGDDCAE